MNTPAYQLPQIEAPSLDDLSVRVSAPPLPSADDLIRRLHEIVWTGSPREKRGPDQMLEWGDEVDCDFVMQLDERLVADAIQRTPRFEVRSIPALPGLVEAMVGMKSHSSRSVELVLPLNYPAAHLAGRAVVFQINVRDAYRVDMPALDDPETLRLHHLGDSVEEAMATVADLIDAEQGDELMTDATEAVLDALAERVKVEIPDAAIDDELLRAWGKGPGAVLARANYSQELVDQARGEYVSAPPARAEARRRLLINLALAALVENEKLQPREQIMEGLLEAASPPLGLDPSQLKKTLGSEPEHAREAAQTALYLSAVEHVMARTKIDVVD